MEDSQLLSDVQLLSDSLRIFPEPSSEPVLVVVSGLPGTGKSFFCGKLAERLRLAVIESDAMRKVLFPQPNYNIQESARLFRAIHTLIEDLLRRSASLILDATNLSERHREELYGIADRLGVRLILVRVEAPTKLVYERLKSRMEDDDETTNSDADWSVYQRMRSEVQPIGRRHYVVNTSEDITPVIEEIVREVKG